MKKSRLSVISLVLAMIMLLGVLSACGSGKGQSAETTAKRTESTSGEAVTTDKESESGETVVESGTSSGTAESDTAASSEGTDGSSEPSDSTETETGGAESTSDGNGTEDLESETKLTGENAQLIEHADYIKNNSTAYYGDSTRTNVVFENMEMALDYALSAGLEQNVTSLKNKSGSSYLENTMDVFVRMENGNTYFASSSGTDGVFNIYRFGYYFYEMRVEEQNFLPNNEPAGYKNVDLRRFDETNDIESISMEDGVLKVQNSATGSDPRFVISRTLGLSTEKYPYIEITMTADQNTENVAHIFFVAGSNIGFTSQQCVSFNIIPDGESHTYMVPFYGADDYTGTLSGLRLDIDGEGATYEIEKIRAVEIEGVKDAPVGLSLARVWNIYADKMHETIQIAATSETNNIKEIGFLTELSADTVEKLIVKDKSGLHESLDGVDWESAEYIGFDIKGAGIFGYILPYDGKGGQIKVTLDADGDYIIEQTMTPEGGTVIPSRGEYDAQKEYYLSVVPDNGNDFYMGHRVYTDPNHTFDEFIFEAECERNPVAASYFKINDSYSSAAAYSGYDSLRGVYRFTLAGPDGGFNTPYYIEQNKHYRINFMVRGDNVDRKIYAMTYTNVGNLESSVMLNADDVLIPVPLEVGKNFSEASGERNLFNIDDSPYGETVFPLVINAKEKYEYTIVNLYQRWGNYPLKQISWIQFYAPYYHLSTGVTETNCVLPWAFTKYIGSENTLPDHRTMSAPFWRDQPQHNSAGVHTWLRYTDSEGNYAAVENIYNTIDAYGPTYADVMMENISDDGRMKLTYTHTEMPQTDENRTYYEIRIEVLEDVSFKDFSRDFQFYCVSTNDPTGVYKYLGYLDEENASRVVEANKKGTVTEYTLGKDCPYFSYFKLENWSSTSQQGYANVAFLVYNSEFVINGEEKDASFAIVDRGEYVSLSLALDEVELKAGDSFSINAILLPWGSQLLDDGVINEAEGNYEYDMLIDGEPYMDKNVRDVRENSLLDPVVGAAGDCCEAIESAFVPKFRTTNGESAEFTISGGYDNVAVRVYGFEKNTVPAIYELVDGAWEKYEVSSINTPDKKGNKHTYDGYMIHYDGDGTFSYSFVTTMDGENARTFKVVADGNYEAWDKEDVTATTVPDVLNIFVDFRELGDERGAWMINKQYISRFEINESESFTRLYGFGPNSNEKEGYVTVYSNSTPTTGGRYLALKYRIPTTNTDAISKFEFFISTSVATASDNSCRTDVIGVVADGNWQIVVIDLDKVSDAHFDRDAHLQSTNGSYSLKLIRWDFFSTRMSASSYVDYGFIGADDDLGKIIELGEGMPYITLVDGGEQFRLDPATGEKISLTPTVPETLVDPESGYVESDLEFGTHIDFLNGNTANLKSGSAIGVASMNLFGNAIADATIADGARVEGSYIVLSGWFMVEGGVNRYVWSADGGKTWKDVETYAMDALSSMKSPNNDNHITVASNRTNGHTFVMADGANGLFSGTFSSEPRGIAANLEDYMGQTVTVIFGAVPRAAQDSIVPFFYLGQVYVKEQPADALTKEEKAEQEKIPVYNEYVKEGSGYSVSSLPYASSVDMINARGGSDDVSNFRNRGGNTAKGIDIFEHSTGTVDGSYLVVTGWTAVNGGVEKYVWSVDGGATWNNVVFHNKSEFSAIGSAHLGVANAQISGYGTIDTSATPNSLYGSGIGFEPDKASGIAADLSAYSGQTVDVIFAAVPNADNDTLCLIACITGVEVK